MKSFETLTQIARERLAEARGAADGAPPEQREGLRGALDRLEEAIAAIRDRHDQPRDGGPAWQTAAPDHQRLDSGTARELDVLRAILNSMTDEVWVCDADSNIVLTNEAASGLGLEEAQEELRSIREVASALEIYDSDGRSRAVENAPLLRSLRGETLRDHEEVVVNPQTGERMVREVSTAPIRDEAGQITGAVGVARNITERVHAEQALQQSEYRYRTLFYDSPIPHWEVDLSAVIARIDDLEARGLDDFRAHLTEDPEEALRWLSSARILSVNKATLDFHGAAHAGDFVDGVPSVLGEGSVEFFTAALVALSAGQTEYDGESVIYALNGEPRDVKLRIRAAPGYESNALRVIASVLDITEQKRAEEELRSSERRLRTVFDSAQIGIVLADAKGKLTRANPALLDMLGYTWDEIRDRSFRDVTHPDDVPSTEELFGALVRGQRHFFRIEKRYLRKDGGLVWADVEVNGIYDEAGDFRYCVCLLQDISARREAEEKLRELNEELEERVRERAAELHRSEARLRMVTDQLPAIVWTTDTELRITSSMGAGLSALNVRPGQMAGTSILDQIRGDPQEASVAAHLRALQGESVAYEREIGVRTWSVHIKPFRDVKDRIVGCIGVGFDVTDQKAMESQLQHAAQMSALGRMAAGIAHEIGNPLASISARVQRLRTHREPEFLDKTVRLLEDQVARINRIVRTVSSIAQTQRKELRNCRLESVLEEAVKLLRVDPRSKGTDIVLSLPAPLPTFMGSPEQLEQICLNIGINALEAMPGGGTLTIEASVGNTQIRILFRDTGTGVPAEASDKLFEPFFSTKSETHMGLGLSLCQDFALAHGGRIEVDSKEGQGSVFRVFLPHRASEKMRAIRGLTAPPR